MEEIKRILAEALTAKAEAQAAENEARLALVATSAKPLIEQATKATRARKEVQDRIGSWQRPVTQAEVADAFQAELTAWDAVITLLHDAGVDTVG